MGNWVEEKLIDKETGFFRIWNSDRRLDIYQSGLGWPLVTTLINGFGKPADWVQRPGLSKVETLFEIINERSDKFEVFYIKNQDEAFSQVDWIREYDHLVPGILDEFILIQRMKTELHSWGFALEIGKRWFYSPIHQAKC